MSPSDPDAAVPHDDHHRGSGAGQLDPRGIGEGAAVEAVEGVGDKEGVEEPATADVRHQDHVRCLDPEARQGPVQGVHAPFVSAPGAEDGGPSRVKKARHGAPPQESRVDGSAARPFSRRNRPVFRKEPGAPRPRTGPGSFPPPGPARPPGRRPGRPFRAPATGS